MKKIMLLLLAFLCLKGFAQNYTVEANKVVPPSPTAAGLGKYGEFGNSGLATGQVDVSVPIYTISYRDLNVPIGLSYNGGGVRPSEIPGWVGLAWNLNAGGVVTRIVQDIADDFDGANGSGIGYYHGRSTLSAITGFPNSTTLEENIDRGRDLKPDKFQFNFNGIGGTFFFDLNGNPVLSSQRKLKIEFSISSSANNFDVFYITTEDGTKYEFSAKEWTRSGMTNTGDPLSFVSSWYLTKITSPLNNEITFSYSAQANKFRYQQSSFQKKVYGEFEPISGRWYEANQEETVRSYGQTEVIYLKEIDFGYGKIDFKTSARNDLTFEPVNVTDVLEEKKLDSMVISYSGSAYKKFAFSYQENPLSRLKLSSFVEIDAQNNPLAPYQFEYSPTELPAFGLSSENSFDVNSVDYWGYFNGVFNAVSRIPVTYIDGDVGFAGSALRDVNPVAAQAEILTRIVYPTGGYTKFTYESNDYSKIAGSAISSSETSWSNVLDFTFTGPDQFEPDPSLITFTLDEPSIVQTWGECNSTGPLHAYCTATTANTNIIELGAGIHTLAEVFGTDNLLNESINGDVDLVHGFLRYRYKRNIYKKLGGGARISRIENYDGTDRLTVKRFEYRQLADSTKSSGVLAKEPVFFRQLSDFFTNVNAFWIQSDPIEAMPDGAPLIYSNVREISPDGGYIDHFYTTYADYPDEYPEMANSLTNGINTYTSRAYKRGLETATKYYTNSGAMVKKFENEFEDYGTLSADVVGYDVRIAIRITTEEGAKEAIIVGKYTIPSRFYVKGSETVTDYSGSQPLVTETTYGYGTGHLQQNLVTTVNSDGKKLRTYTKYPADYAISSSTSASMGLYSLKERHIENRPVERYTELLSASDVSQGNINGMYNAFDSNGMLSGVYTFKNTAPATSFAPAHVSGDNIVYDSSVYDKKLDITAYDEAWNIAEQSKPGAPINSYKWGYNRQFPILEAKNAANNEIYVQDFEEYTGTATGTAHTGSKYYNGSFTATWTKPNSRAYGISYWYLDSGTWKFKKEPYSSTSLALSGGSAYDDIVICPVDAFVSAYTYRPLVGLTSSTDAKGQTTYFDHDTFGRLASIKDQNGDIVKNYSYHLANNLTTPVYYNTELRQKYVKNDCVGEAIAGIAEYVVPANKYSASSAIAANALAVADTLANGQAYTNQAAGCVPFVPILLQTDAVDNTASITGVKVYYQASLMFDFAPNDEMLLPPNRAYTVEVYVSGNLYDDIYGTGYGSVRLESDGITGECQPHPNSGPTSVYTFTFNLNAGTYIRFNATTGFCN